jgi:hypothetical protein
MELFISILCVTATVMLVQHFRHAGNTLLRSLLGVDNAKDRLGVTSIDRCTTLFPLSSDGLDRQPDDRVLTKTAVFMQKEA